MSPFFGAKDNIWRNLSTLTLHLWEDLSTDIVSGNVVVLGITYNLTLTMMMIMNLLLSN
jgi:hypothetical protein